MNLVLLGYLLALAGILYSVVVILLTYLAFRELSVFMKNVIEVNLNKELLVLVVAIIYIVTYHLP